jgi:transglutaminase-like putative cysteine protease
MGYATMLIRFGFEIKIRFTAATPMVLLLSPHPSVRNRLLVPAQIQVDPFVDQHLFIDTFGNEATRIVAPSGEIRLFYNSVINDSGLPDFVQPDADQLPIERVPDDVLSFLLDSRYCETELLADAAWSLFGSVKPGWERVQAICDWVNSNVEFGYEYARATRTALEVYNERQGVCRDFTHLAIGFCRVMNIPARYCNGYLGDIGVPVDPNPGDFSAWFEAYLGDEWYTFDARHNMQRIGRILVSRGRDAKDVAMTTSFGFGELRQFTIWTDEVNASDYSSLPDVTVTACPES